MRRMATNRPKKTILGAMFRKHVLTKAQPLLVEANSSPVFHDEWQPEALPHHKADVVADNCRRGCHRNDDGNIEVTRHSSID